MALPTGQVKPTEMKSKRLTLVTVALMVALGSTAGYEHLRNRKLAHLQAQSTAAIAASVGRMSSVLLALENDALPRNRLAAETRTTITQLSLVLVSNEMDIGALDADAFSGLCRLVANADKLFPLSSTTDPEGQMNRLLNRQLSALQASVRNESAARTLRPGDHHECALK